ncbi:MAG: glycosyltransferase family 4 protein [Verrucomicrobiota bacterium]
MKVLQILPELNAGGVERVVMVLSDYLVANGHQSIVVSNGGRQVASLEKSGARHIALPVHRKSLGSLFQVRPMRQVLEQERPDILHLHSRVPGWIAWLAWRKMNPQTRPRLASTVHGFYSVNAYSAIMTRGERIIAVSECIRDYVAKNFPQTPPAALRLVRHGLALADYPRGFQPDVTWRERWLKDFPQFTGKQLLLLPGRITRLKGHEDFLHLIAALFKTNPQIHGVIVGDTHPRKRAYLDELKQLVQQLGLASAVTFVGHRSDLREIMAMAQVICSLSTSPESFGLTTLEALALGRPVIGYDHGGVGELLHKLYPTGCVPLRDEAALLTTTQQLLALHSSPTPVQEPFTLDAMCRSTLDVYRELLQASRR